jgi:ABC-type dipeptide/oligopeptide/nickel transport system ATPase component
MKLKISAEVELPVDAVTERLAFVGQSGSGKTYAAMRLGELMLEAGAQIIVLDPMSVWWGLLSAANGKASGFPVHVFGGEHAHVPLVPEAGALVADVIVERGISAVLDIADLTLSDQVMFASAFAERFYAAQRKLKHPVHLFFEEAHNFLPQNLPPEGRDGDPRKNPAVMLNRMERIVRQGRSLGIGCSMISQQPQAVNKKALNQAGTLFAMRTMGKHERKAISDWMADKATDAEQLNLDALLSKLGTGEAWLASPHLLNVFKKVSITKKTTFDSSSTPKFGVKLEPPKVLAEVDVEKLRESMKAVVDQVEKDDPAPLRKRVAELERQLAAKPATAPKLVEVPVLTKDDRTLFAASVTAVLKATQVLERERGELQQLLNKLEPLANPVLTVPASLRVAPAGLKPNGHVYVDHSRAHAAVARAESKAPAAAGDFDPTINGCDLGARKMLAELAGVYPKGLTQRELATRSLLSHGGSTYRTYKSQLSTRGFIEKDAGGDMAATQAGVDAVRGMKPVGHGELVALWGQKIDLGARKMLNALLEAGGPLTPKQLAAAASVGVGGSTYRTYKSQLTSTGLAEKRGEGLVAGHALFIGEGA